MPLFSPNRLPASLWRDSVLHFPDWLNDVYEAKLGNLGLLELARGYHGHGGAHGGGGIEATHEHYYKMYLNSVSRVQCLVLDPQEVFHAIAYDLLATLSSHRIAILDIPCGAGASVLSALSTLAELRRERLLPMTPLSISVLGGDISPHALGIYREQFDNMAGRYFDVGIEAVLTTRPWDATNVQQTNQMIDDWLQANPDAQEHLVFIANISGAAKTLLRDMEESFRQVWIRLSSNATPNSTIIWIEPIMRSSEELFNKLKNFFGKYVWFVPFNREGVILPSCRYAWFSRVQGKSVPGTVSVHRYRRAR